MCWFSGRIEKTSGGGGAAAAAAAAAGSFNSFSGTSSGVDPLGDMGAASGMMMGGMMGGGLGLGGLPPSLLVHGAAAGGEHLAAAMQDFAHSGSLVSQLGMLHTD